MTTAHELGERLKDRTPVRLGGCIRTLDGELLVSPDTSTVLITEAERDALVARLEGQAWQWNAMDVPMPSDRQVLVCWSTGAYDTIGVEEYMEIMGYGEPPARGWCELPAPPSIPPAQEG